MEKEQYTHRYMQRYVSSGLAMADSPHYNPTPKAQAILDVLHEAGEWIGRSELAIRLNKNALNKWDIVLLSKLGDAGLIEMRQIPHHGPIGYEWQYRAISN
jgi:hypothetical protein